MTPRELRDSADYYHHHTGSRRGYVSRKGDGIVEPYSGRFGEGYRIISPRWDTTMFVNVEYYILKED